MTLLILGLLLFLGVHSLRELRLREPAAKRLGQKGFQIAYSLVALVGLALLVWGKSGSPFVMIYEPRYELRGITHFAMLPAFILVVAGNLPLSHLRHATRNPMVLGTLVWGVAHLWANGDLASLLLFGAFAAWAGLKFITLARRVPAAQSRPAFVWDAAAIVLGFFLYGLVTVFHGQLFGIGLNFA